MLSTDARTSNHDYSLDSSQQSKARRINPFENLSLCQKLQDELRDVAIQRIGSDLLKSLLSIRQSGFINARNTTDIPHGLFGLSFYSFNARHKENSVYIDVLHLADMNTLQQAKMCVVLDDLQDFVGRLFVGCSFRTMEPILREIRDSLKLLTVSETIENDFKKNSTALKKLQDKLSLFNVRERNAILSSNNQVYGIQNTCVVTETVIDPIEFRFKMKFHHHTAEQLKEKSHQVEEKLQTTLNHFEKARARENIASDSVRIKQGMDIEILNTKIEEMTEKYDRDYDRLDGQISSKKSAIEAMQNLHSDCLEKLEFYTSDILRLKEWQEKWEQKKMEADVKKVTKPKKKKKTSKKK